MAHIILPHMRYKTFTFPHNPTKCSYSCEKVLAKHKYPELVGVDIEDFDPDAAIIVGNGEFFGVNAYSYWNKLNAVFRLHGPGDFYHPIFKDVTKAIMKKLDADLEPADQYIAYTFEIWQYIPPIKPVKPISTGSSHSSGSGSSSGGYFWYHIKWGDTLWDLARKYLGNATRYPEIARLNGIKNPNKIYAGHWLKIPKR